jgi:threonine/homoserine/homoserine lactone efflux protein
MSVLLFGFGFGIVLCASPGAVMMLTIRLGLQRGFRPAWIFQIGSCVGSAIWGVLGLTGLLVLAEARWVHIVLGVIGAALLLVLAWGSIRTALTGVRGRSQAREHDSRNRHLFASGAGVSLANPLQLVFWLAVGTGLQGQGLNSHAPMQLTVFLAAFITATVVWGTGLALLVSAGRRFVGAHLSRAIGLAAGVALSGLACYLAINTAHVVLGV